MADMELVGVDRSWFGGGAVHTPESARRQTYAATGGAEGVGGVNDLLVRPWAVPGQGVRVAVGSALILSKYIGGETQTYMGTAYKEQILNITPAGSQTGRSDLVVARVRDPFAQGSPWPEPPVGEIATEQYVYFEIIPGVPAGTTRLQSVAGHANDTAITLARIDLPKSTGTVDNITGKVVDLRQVARPRRLERQFARPRVQGDNGAEIYLTASVANGGEYFPGGGGVPNEFQVDVPAWATRMIIDARWMSVSYGLDRRPTGAFWIEYGDEYRDHTWPAKHQWEFSTQDFWFNAPRNDVGSTIDWSLADEVPVPAKLRGKPMTVVFKAGVSNVPGANHTWMGAYSGLTCRITFAEQALDTDLL